MVFQPCRNINSMEVLERVLLLSLDTPSKVEGRRDDMGFLLL